MKRVITYGTYDLLHTGHVTLLKRAKELGDYLIVGITSDAFDKSRGKLNVKQSLVERIGAVQKTGIADKIIVEEYEGQKISDIQTYKIDIFTVGSDWIGKFDYLNSYCRVVYLPRTMGVSSTDLRKNLHSVIKFGMIGSGYGVQRFYDESLYVSGVQTIGKYSPENKSEISCSGHMPDYTDLEQMLEECDAVYIDLPIKEHFYYIMQAFQHKCHVVCMAPVFLSAKEAETAYKYAGAQNLILFEAVKTLYFPAFEHLLLLIHSGVIGKIKDVEVACSQVPSDNLKEDINRQDAFLEWGGIALLPIIKILGTEYTDCHLYNFENRSMTFIRGILEYPDAMASFKVGKGIKFEGSLVITGENGYIFVPAPWWKTDYFEIRYEDLRRTKKYFFDFEGEGIRYEIQKFVEKINYRDMDMSYSMKETLCETDIMQQYYGYKCKFAELEGKRNEGIDIKFWGGQSHGGFDE